VLQADAAGGAAERGVRDHERWQAARADRLARGATPSMVAAPVTELAAKGASAEREVEVVEVAARAPRPGGRRFGTLVHALLAVAPLDADARALDAAAALQGRIVGATGEEIAAAAVAARDALRHPLLRRAAASAAVRRETPVLLQREDGVLAEGVVDLAFREPGGGWVVVDFKTDRELEARRDVYAAQVQLYADAVAKATGEPARGMLLVV
jgi:ATP-dependent exoDNAse (exonuclease V) beta subunit